MPLLLFTHTPDPTLPSCWSIHHSHLHPACIIPSHRYTGALMPARPDVTVHSRELTVMAAQLLALFGNGHPSSIVKLGMWLLSDRLTDQRRHDLFKTSYPSFSFLLLMLSYLPFHRHPPFSSLWVYEWECGGPGHHCQTHHRHRRTGRRNIPQVHNQHTLPLTRVHITPHSVYHIISYYVLLFEEYDVRGCIDSGNKGSWSWWESGQLHHSLCYYTPDLPIIAN